MRGDLATTRSELSRRYAGNLCLVNAPDTPSLAEQARASAAAEPLLTQLMLDGSNGILGFGQFDNFGASVVLMMVTPELTKRLDPRLDLRPWLRPAP